MKKNYHEFNGCHSVLLFENSVQPKIRTFVDINFAARTATMSSAVFDQCDNSTTIIIHDFDISGTGIHRIERSFRWFRKICKTNKENKSKYIYRNQLLTSY